MTLFDDEERQRYIDETVGLLTSRYRKKPVISSILAAHASQWFEIESVAKDLLNKRTIDDAEGHVLDRIGDLIGLPRQVDETDSSYRNLLFIKLGINLSKGLPENIIDIVSRLTGGGVVHLIGLGNAMISLGADGELNEAQGQFLADNVGRIIAAGVGIASFSTYPKDSFCFGSRGEAGEEGGFSRLLDRSVTSRSSDKDHGGRFAKLLVRRSPANVAESE